MKLRDRTIRGDRRVTVAVLTVLLAGMAVCPAFAGPGAHGASGPHEKRPDPKHQVQALEEQWRVAQLAGDTATMDKMLSDDYIGISMTGEVDTKAQQLRRVTDRRLMLTKIELSDMKVKLVGEIAIVTSRAEVEGTIDGTSVKGMYRYTRVYQHLPTGHWKITSFEATRERRNRNQVDGGAMGKDVPSGG